ncbi:hypothetical protein QQF64_013199 [Cirrhinus molitorella]|uniref:Uncharacterized protein n=1 Tax=Cirrhinus molitorella TaxID=172907 RepID=A0ABR3LUM1_9TELE
MKVTRVTGLPLSPWAPVLGCLSIKLPFFLSLNPFFASTVILPFPLGSLPQIINRSPSQSSFLKKERKKKTSLSLPASSRSQTQERHLHTQTHAAPVALATARSSFTCVNR